jgi:hypothetical protein
MANNIQGATNVAGSYKYVVYDKTDNKVLLKTNNKQQAYNYCFNYNLTHKGDKKHFLTVNENK